MAIVINESQVLNRFKYRSLIFAFILPLVFTGLWLIKNTQLPSADAANFLSTALNIYHHFIHDGFVKGIISCYSDRGFRPIFFPVLAEPFLLMTHGNMYMAYSLVAMSCLLASLMYIYLFLRLQLDRVSAILATNLIGLLPLLQVQLLGFYAESAFFPCVIGLAYHLIKSDYLRQLKHVFACILLFTLAVTLRPVEASMHLIFLISLFVYYGWRESVFKMSDIAIVLSLCVTSILLFFIAAAHPSVRLIVSHVTDKPMQEFFIKILGITAGLTALSWMLVFIPSTIRWSKKIIFQNHLNEPQLVPFALISLMLILIWFFPFAFDTFQWVYGTSFGDIAAGTIVGKGGFFSSQTTFLNELNKHVQVEGRVVVLGVVFAALANGLYLLKQKRFAIFVSMPVLYLLAIVPLPLLEIFLTAQDWSRKVAVAFPVLLMIMLMIGLQRGRFWIARAAFLAIILFLHFVLVMAVAFENKGFNPLLDKMVGYYIRPPVLISNNPHDVVRDFLTLHANRLKLKNIAIEVNANTIEPVDPFLMVVKVQAENVDYIVSYPYVAKFSTHNSEDFKTKYDGLFLSANANDMKVSKVAANHYYKSYLAETNPSIKTLYYFLYHYAKNDLSTIGWKTDSCTVIKTACLVGDVQKARREADCFGCLLLPIKNKTPD